MSDYSDDLFVYNCQDTCITFEIWETIQKNVDAMGLRGPCDFQQRLFNAVLETMNRGVRFDTKRQNEYELMLMDEIAKREQYFIEVLGHPLNPRSPKQLGNLFYKDFLQRPIMNYKTHTPTLNDAALSTIAAREPILRPLVRKIQEYRSLGVFLSTFVRMPLDSDGRMRCSYNIAGTETFRFSSSKNPFGMGGNLQNIPKGGESDDGEDPLDLPNIRELFIPEPHHTFFDIDLSKSDLRIVVWEADVKEAKMMLKEGKDPYIELAREFYKDPSIKKIRDDGTENPKYKTFKSFSHGSNYMGGAKGLAGRLGLTVKEAEATQKWYFERFPEIKKYHERIINDIKRQRFVQNIFGNRWYAFDRIDDATFRQAAAWVGQSTTALVINHGLVNIYENLREVQCLLQVHDSISGQFSSHLGEWAEKRIVEECSITLPFENDPLIIPVAIKTSTESWGKCE